MSRAEWPELFAEHNRIMRFGETSHTPL